ncbi:hypothetical protein OEZ85_009053 [Tetradesmus obliquus]|uniref:60S ribosomal protein L7a n=1 Tax=Tetradesmus obliquus TaxID=3088 RepID=A0ABY8TKM9_TETOB|nr:hypothetical protein OEZ85_009053 [Tetradesmus obliquus]
MSKAAAISIVAVFLLLELAIVSWCTLWPIGSELHELVRFAGWRKLYHVATSTLDVWLLAVLRICVMLVLWSNTNTAYGRSRRHGSVAGGLGLGPPLPPNHEQMALGAALASGSCELLLLLKAVAVAVWAPDMVMPSPSLPGISGLLCTFVALTTSLCSSLVTGLVLRWLIYNRGRPAASKADEESAGAEVTRPLLAASWELPENNKRIGAAGKDAEEAEQKPLQPGTVLELVRMTVPDMPVLLFAFLFGVAAALMAACVPYFTGLIIDYASIDPDRRRFSMTTLKLVAVAVLCGVFTGVRGGLFSVAMWRLNVRIRTTLFNSLLTQEIGFFDTQQTGEISSRLSADTTTVSDSITLNLNILVRTMTQAVMVLVFMFGASWRLTVVTFVLVPCVLLISKVYGSYYRKLSKKAQAALAEANAVAEEVLSAQATVRAHAAQDSAKASYAAKLHVFYLLMVKQAAAYSVYAATTTFLPSVVVAVVLYYGGLLVLNGDMSAGGLVSFMLYQQSLSSAFSMMGDVFSALTAAVGAADKVIELIKRTPKESPSGDFIPDSGTLQGALALDNVVFAYPIRPTQRVLNGLSMSVNPGEVVALVGPSGGGKTTIIKLLQRFYLPSSGLVLVDGRDIGLYDPKWLRRHVALVSQEPVLFARSVARNIMYGLEREDGCADAPTQEAVEEAARQANAHDFISAFPEGYQTGCGEKGVVLSGGQKQRIAIARALVRQPQVLLLDEATSALDTESEAVVQEALNRLMAGRTVVVVAHRLSTIRDAHRICVVSQGQHFAEPSACFGPFPEVVISRGAFKMAPKKKVAPAPGAVKKAAAPKKETNPLFEKRPKNFGLGGNPAPKRDLRRFVKWPKYVRLQRQRRVLSMRLKVPPVLNQFVTRALDKNQAETLFKLLLKYRPEDKKQKAERLKAEAEAREAGKELEKKKPLVVKFGLNHVTTLVEAGKAQLVVIAHDVDPIELVVWLPALCKKMGVPYCIVKGKARLGAIVHQKNAAALAVTGVKNEDQREFGKLVESFKNQFNEGARVQWGGGIMGIKSQHKQKQKERILAKELAQRMTV